ncbi:leucine-rich repeat domain-containing protein [Bacteroides ovatus]|nr:leucine-rich repeat domain-containing protein [Bacteroides ovatus]
MISITIPRNVTEIAGWAFYSCKALTSVTIQEGVTRIGEMAFGDCRALTSVTIPQSVMKIGQWAFSNDQLTVKCLPTSPPSPSSPAPFILKKLYVPASSVDSYKKAWEGAYKDIIFPL